MERVAWFPTYSEDKKIYVDLQQSGTVVSINPIFKASIPELITLMLCKSGFTMYEAANIQKIYKTIPSNHMTSLRRANHTYNGNLFKKTKILGLNNPMALTGLAVSLINLKKRNELVEKINLASLAMNNKLWENDEMHPFGVFIRE